TYGMKVDLVPAEFRAEGLVELFQKFQGSKGEGLKGLRFLLPRAEKAREIFPDRVRELGGEIDVPVAYRTIKPEFHGKRLRRFLREGRISIATFTSAATFNNFREIMGKDAEEFLRALVIAVIGPVTAKAVEKAGLHVDIMPKEATIEAMVKEIIEWGKEKKTNGMNETDSERL
ncbi:MAG: uroporphyrinogen-III synthase, partial [Nitrospirales bacterium]